MDCVKETDTDITIVTETWLRDADLDSLKIDLSKGSGFGLLARNRGENGRGISYGGVAVMKS